MSIEAFFTPDVLSSEELLLQHLEEICTPSSASRVSRCRVVVPTTHLRDHLYRVISTRRRSWIGLDILSLHHFAGEILDRFEHPHRGNHIVFRILIRRLAATLELPAETERPSSHLIESVASLLDAGFEPSHQEAFFELLELEKSRFPNSQWSRAREIGRLSLAVRQLEESWGAITLTGLLQQAAEVIRTLEPTLDHDHLLIYGFQRPKPAERALLLALASKTKATAILDSAPSILSESCDDEAPHNDRQIDWLQSFEHRRFNQSDSLREPTRTKLVVAATPEIETRLVSSKIRSLLEDETIVPEAITVVLASPEIYAPLLTHSCSDLGIPYSSPAIAGSNAKLQRLFSFLLVFLEQGGDTNCDLYRSLFEDHQDLESSFESLESFQFEGASEQRVANSLAALQRWKEVGKASLIEHLRSLAHVLEAFGPHDSAERLQDWFGSFSRLIQRSVPDSFELESAEMLALLREHRPKNPLGGRGRGVQIHSDLTFQGLTSQYLFVLGVTRDAYPKSGLRDPFLPDSLRSHLRSLFPDLDTGHQQLEDSLAAFSRMVRSTTNLWLSYPEADSSRRPCTKSPLLNGIDATLERYSSPFEAPFRTRLTRAEHDLARIRVEGIDSSCMASAIGRSRARIDFSREDILSSRTIHSALLGRHRWFGAFHGQLLPERLTGINLTKLESYAVCPWRSFLETLVLGQGNHEYGQEVPRLGPRAIGNTVHKALETVAQQHRSWPASSELTEILQSAADEVLQEEDARRLDFAPVLAVLARPYVDRARELVWSEKELRVERVEVSERYRLDDSSGIPATISFRIDLLEKTSTGNLLSTDYKTGSGPRGHHSTHQILSFVRRGKWLQAPVYAVSSRHSARFVFLARGQQSLHSILRVEPSTQGLRQAIDQTLRILVDARREGIFFPRLLEPNSKREPRACATCAVSQACSRGEESVVQRLENYLRRAPISYRALWDLPGTAK